MMKNENGQALFDELETPQDLAADLRYRFTGSTQGKLTPEIKIAAAFFISYSGRSKKFHDQFLAELGLRLGHDQMGSLVIMELDSKEPSPTV